MHLIGENCTGLHLLKLFADVQAVLSGKMDFIFLNFANSVQNSGRMVCAQQFEMQDLQLNILGGLLFVFAEGVVFTQIILNLRMVCGQHCVKVFKLLFAVAGDRFDELLVLVVHELLQDLIGSLCIDIDHANKVYL